MKNKRSIIMWILGVVICAFGVALTSKASFGVGVIQGPTYAIFMKLSDSLPWLTFGMCSYLMEALFLIILCVIMRKIKWKYLLSFVTAFIFGLALDGWRLVIGTDVSTNLTLRIVELVIGIASISFAVACYFRTDMPLEVWELFVKEISDRFNLNSVKFKWFFDLSMLVIGIALSFIFFGKLRFDVIGIGTIIAAFVSGPLIGLFGKMLDKMI